MAKVQVDRRLSGPTKADDPSHLNRFLVVSYIVSCFRCLVECLRPGRELCNSVSLH